MSGKAGRAGDGNHGPALLEGIGTALSWLTIIPAPSARTFDRITGARAMAALPVAGLALGLMSLPLAYLPSSPLVIAALAVVVWELGSRMMHIDGLADVGDALGSYAPPERAQEILGDRYTGALGMGAALLTLLTQVVCLAELLPVVGPVSLVFLPVLGRICAMVGCHRAFRPFSPTGFGSLIIGTVRTWWIALWLLGSCGVAFVFSGAYSVILAGLGAVVVAVVFARHCARRFLGLNGDTTGALIEISVACAAATMAAFSF